MLNGNKNHASANRELTFLNFRTVFQITQLEGSEFWVLTSGPGPSHSWVRALGERSLAVLKFASGRVDRAGEKG